MGFAYVNVTVSGQRTSSPIEMLADTGSTYIVLHPNTVKELGLLETPYKVSLTLADRRSIEAKLFLGEVEVQGRKGPVFVAELDTPRPLLGVYALETLGFKVNPKTGELEEIAPEGGFLLTATQAAQQTKPTISIVIPPLNEEETIGKVIDEIPRQALEGKGCDVSVLVVDGNSLDRTRQIAEAKGAEVIIEPRKGKGRAVRTAFEQVKADFVFILDADYTYPATYIPDMLDILEQGYSVVTGSRLKGKREGGAMSRLNVVGNHLLTWMANILYWTRISDLCTGYWGFRGEVIPDLHLLSDGFHFEAELFTQIAKKRYPIAEIPIYYRRRQTPPKLSSLKDGIKIGWRLITERFW